MATTRADISIWFDDGVKQGATHMIVMCDTFDYCDYPVYITENDSQTAKERVAKKNADMQKVMEVYKLSMDKDEQLAARRAFNY